MCLTLFKANCAKAQCAKAKRAIVKIDKSKVAEATVDEVKIARLVNVLELHLLKQKSPDIHVPKLNLLMLHLQKLN